MERRNFLKVAAASSASFITSLASAEEAKVEKQSERNELTYHKLKDIRFDAVQLKYPRLVGKNSRLGIHGTGPNLTFCTLLTDKGAEGLGLMRGNRQEAEKLFEGIKGKSVSDLFSPALGTLEERYYIFDICLHDLAGVILNKPVYALISGNERPIVTQCYSGMIYFDEMEPENKPSGLNKILENCLFDYNYGYRQFKVKIGRGGKWMAKDEGLKMDITVTKLIYENFPDCDILVDGNDAYTVDEFISYLKGIENIPLYWIEEPFRETREDYIKLRNWLDANGRRHTLLGDGEANPDFNLNMELGKDRILDVYLEDMLGYGFTPWRKLTPRLKSMGMMASPHAWGDTIKSFYVSHYVGAYGNVPTIEGVTCFSSDMDLSTYKLVRGRLTPNSSPGFGLKLWK